MKDDRLKIVHLSGMMSRGGGENHILNLTEELINLGQESTVYCPQESQLASELLEKGLPVEPMRLRFKADPRFFLRFGKYCRKNKVDVVHVHDPVAMFLIILASYFFKMPTAILSKKTSFPIKQRKRTIYKYNHPIFKKIICVSKEVARVTSLSVREQEKITTIYNGSNLSILAQLQPEFDLRSRLNISDNKKIVLHIANHTKPKDLSTFVKVIQELKHRDDVHFVQIGRHTEQTILIEEEIQKSGLQEKVSFLGELKNAAVYLNQADISLITSKSEGLPQVIYESFYYKIPIVSTKAGGIAEVVENGNNGFLAEIGDHLALAGHIKTIVDDRTSLDEMMANNFDLVTAKYDSKIMARKTLDLYRKVLESYKTQRTA